MIVPVRRWATMATIGREESDEKPHRQHDTNPEGRITRKGILDSFESLLTVHTDLVIRSFAD